MGSRAMHPLHLFSLLVPEVGRYLIRLRNKSFLSLRTNCFFFNLRIPSFISLFFSPPSPPPRFLFYSYVTHSEDMCLNLLKRMVSFEFDVNMQRSTRRLIAACLVKSLHFGIVARVNCLYAYILLACFYTNVLPSSPAIYACTMYMCTHIHLPAGY